MERITCKFGGSSLADSSCIRQVIDIIRANPARKYIVPSAPGKRTAEEKKITDLLYAWHNMARQGLDPTEPKSIIEERFSTLARELGVSFNVQPCLEEIAEHASRDEAPDYMASRGEYLNGKLIAEALGAVFVDPAECILFKENGQLDPRSYDLLGEKLQGDGLFVVPGFYGATPKGEIKTFSRGGSDISGSIVARATRSSLYENWTDVSGFRMADPRIVPDAKRIEEITYRELRELSYMGATVLHDEAIFPVREPGIPIQILNTKKPDSPGTLIVARRDSGHPVCGIAGRRGFTMFNIEKTLMNKEHGFGRKLLSIFEEHRVSWEHMPTGIDTISIIASDDELKGKVQTILESIERLLDPDDLTVTSGLAIVATVGKGMNRLVGVAARLTGALAEAGVNIRVINQGSSEMNILIGVEEQDLEKAVSAIYHAFDSWQ
ncbi:MAG TPA: aspartate kinase [Candidatus Hydrogenedentes bacterium]|jgi:aspartate kinase|nr:aspartate kinase [Candidatus Hydrogenedentota bacterium]HOD94156.1 aspartate kinase [Candidatus Hydrogenedentota bacterium]HPX85098.1 aspartate kinase [Candidatus Hydrogenedentota bacterium]